ncbi:hypothetical protein Tdes44962_MAKER09760 [Teratosphaeria destructans]|uniref:Uncharacterized protein n=1 Tax=Teratosphaeria destructans TaxID=418781 RepID=A0A9W7W2D1_9PEZI|nr:hypothetical protein Tdes44962_MAKER09760 [Teratosphaeria destructans]
MVSICAFGGKRAPAVSSSSLTIATTESTPLLLTERSGWMSSVEIDSSDDSLARIAVRTTVAASSMVLALFRSASIRGPLLPCPLLAR